MYGKLEDMIFKLRKTSKIDIFLINIGLQFKLMDKNHIRTLVGKDVDFLDEENIGMAERFIDNNGSIWTRGYLLNKFIKKEFEYLGSYK
jgi:hypothetical protein